MDNIHRTCQQSFARLIFGWIKHLSESQNIDNRNKQTIEVSKRIVDAYTEKYDEEFPPGIPLV